MFDGVTNSHYFLYSYDEFYGIIFIFRNTDCFIEVFRSKVLSWSVITNMAMLSNLGCVAHGVLSWVLTKPLWFSCKWWPGGGKASAAWSHGRAAAAAAAAWGGKQQRRKGSRCVERLRAWWSLSLLLRTRLSFKAAALHFAAPLIIFRLRETGSSQLPCYY